jgi:amino acid transporter
MAQNAKPTMVKTLSLTGVSVNAMALIAPGAFLWITFQVQVGQTVPGGTASTALEMWPGLFFAFVLALLTALSYSELARIFPEAGTGSCYYFAEKAFMDKEDRRHHRWARVAKLVTGWAAHLFYWVYPGVMVAFMATLVSYILGQFGISIGTGGEIVVAILFAALVGYIAFRGITGSTTTALFVNVIQLVALVVFAVLAIAYRVMNPDSAVFAQPSASAVVTPHDLTNVLFQATIAILLLVGFESATAFGAEAKNARRDVPRAVLIALVIQCAFAYLFEYFAANFALANTTVVLPDGVTPATASVDDIIAGAAASQAPIGDMAVAIGNALLGGAGFVLMITIALTVALALLGTTLSAINTGVRISYAMGQDREMPEFMGLLHGRFATPHVAVVALAALSAIIGAIGTLNLVTLTGISIASNVGTFVLYALTNLWALVAFAGRREHSLLKHGLVPVLGLLANIVMLVTVVAMGFSSGGDSQTEALMAIGFAVVWAVVSAVFVIVNSRRWGRSLLETPGSAPATRT